MQKASSKKRKLKTRIYGLVNMSTFPHGCTTRTARCASSNAWVPVMSPSKPNNRKKDNLGFLTVVRKASSSGDPHLPGLLPYRFQFLSPARKIVISRSSKSLGLVVPYRIQKAHVRIDEVSDGYAAQIACVRRKVQSV